MASTHLKQSINLARMEGHRMQLLSQEKIPPPIFVRNSFRLTPWMKEFVASLGMDDMALLRDCGLTVRNHMLTNNVNTGLLEAAINFWNPRTNTFFFPRGEMCIMIEEVAPLLGIRPSRAGDRDNLNRISRFGTFEKRHFENICEKDVFPGCIVNNRLSLSRVWHKYKPALRNRSSAEDRTLLDTLIVVIFGGIFLFPSPLFDVPKAVVAMLMTQFKLQNRCMVQAVLAFLMSGLSSASQNKGLFGSVWLLQKWLICHLPRISRIDTHSGFPCTVHQSHEEWLSYLANMTDSDIDFRPYKTAELLVPQKQVVFGLVGVYSFMNYPARRCMRMLGANKELIMRKCSFTPEVLRDLSAAEADQAILSNMIKVFSSGMEVISLSSDFTRAGPGIQQTQLIQDGTLSSYCEAIGRLIYHPPPPSAVDPSVGRPQKRHRRG